jgi:hypothetical protein
MSDDEIDNELFAYYSDDDGGEYEEPGAGDGFHPVDLREVLVALSSLVDLIVDEITVRDELAAEEKKREKEAAAKKKQTARVAA